MLAALFAVLFGLSLLPGRKPLCLRFAERISDGILPDGAVSYCRRLTWIWFAILTCLACSGLVFFFVGLPLWGTVPSLIVVPLTFLIEGQIRRRRFSVVFHTSGSTGKSKTIIKTFESLAREVAYHRAVMRRHLGGDCKPVFLATVDPGHMYGILWRVLLPQSMGSVCDPAIILSPEELLAKMREHEKVFLVTTPSFLDRFTAYANQYDVPQNCVEIVTSGALLTKEVSDRTEKVFGIAPRQIFGSTETGGVAWRRGDDAWQIFDEVRVRAVKTADASQTRLTVRSPYSFVRGWYTMGDGIDLAPGGRTFRLLGRTDRLVKINEERVNLAEMEAGVRAAGFADCALAVLDGERGPMLGAVLVAAPTMPAHLSSLDLRKMLLPVFPKGTVPRRFRLVRMLPRNSQGKVLTAEIVRLLESSLVEPHMENVVETADAFSADFIFDAAAPYFQGHFSGMPVLPGVVQVGLAVRLAESMSGGSLVLKAVKKMKFMHIITPGVRIAFRLTRKSASEFAYEYKKGEALCSSGVLQF